MMMLAIALGLVLPWAAGTLIWLALVGRPTRRLQWLIALSYGFVGGCLLAAGSSALVLHLGGTSDVALPACTLLLLLAFAAGLIARSRAPEIVRVEAPADGWRWVIALLIALLAVRVGGLAFELLMRPVFPWDAWAAWMPKAKTWFLLGEWVPFAIEYQWPMLTDPGVRPSLIAHYPNTSAYLQLFLASALGEWNEPFVNSPTLGIYLALLLGSWAQLRVLGAGWLTATLATYLIGSLPLLGSHVALAGYVDLFVATQFSLAFLCLARARLLGQPRQFVAALALVLLLPVWKLEGAIWLACVAPMVVFGFLPLAWRRWVLALGLFGLVIVVVLQRFALPLPGLGWIIWNGEFVTVGGIGVAKLSWQGLASGLTDALFVAPNWHLMAYLLPLTLIWAGWMSRRDSALRQLGSISAFAIVYLLVIFLFTEAARWMADLTGVNRVLMQVLPVFALYCVIVWLRQAPRILRG